MHDVPLLNGKSRVYVYAISAPELSIFKIGKSLHPKKRYSTLKSIFPVDLELLGYVLDTSGGYLEAWLHAYLQGSRKKGEWFRDTEETRKIVDLIVSNKISEMMLTVNATAK